MAFDALVSRALVTLLAPGLHVSILLRTQTGLRPLRPDSRDIGIAS